MKALLILIALFSAAAHAETRKVTGQPARNLFTALVQAGLPEKVTKRDGLFNLELEVRVASMDCEVEAGGAHDDGVDTASCSGVRGTSAAIAVANALIGAGIDSADHTSHESPKAKDILCVVNNEHELVYTCTLTGDFFQP